MDTYAHQILDPTKLKRGTTSLPFCRFLLPLFASLISKSINPPSNPNSITAPSSRFLTQRIGMSDPTSPTKLPLLDSMMIPKEDTLFPSLAMAGLQTPTTRRTTALPKMSLKPRKSTRGYVDTLDIVHATYAVPSIAAATGTAAARTHLVASGGFSTPLFSRAPSVESLVQNAPQFPDCLSPTMDDDTKPMTAKPFLPRPKKHTKRSRPIEAATRASASRPSLTSRRPAKTLTSSVFMPDIPDQRTVSPESCADFSHSRIHRRLKMRPTTGLVL
ncbi:expressed unknown protein [Seminavis robusta]|uniref:Uncharacterized protein n=1 Tax=Seminavis robusta TaxID=568900 RepID=A0A9N8ELJ6_9STRA|nr:expressed unknown protein [Seminavis robusta]|eukprot:Sro1403_g269690.1 n/a (274) ;mRNA; f:18269-19090